MGRTIGTGGASGWLTTETSPKWKKLFLTIISSSTGSGGTPAGGGCGCGGSAGPAACCLARSSGGIGVSWGSEGAVNPTDVDGGEGEKLTVGPAGSVSPKGGDALEELVLTSKLPSLTSTLIIPLRSCGSGEVGAESAPRDLMIKGSIISLFVPDIFIVMCLERGVVPY